METAEDSQLTIVDKVTSVLEDDDCRELRQSHRLSRGEVLVTE